VDPGFDFDSLFSFGLNDLSFVGWVRNETQRLTAEMLGFANSTQPTGDKKRLSKHGGEAYLGSRNQDGAGKKVHKKHHTRRMWARQVWRFSVERSPILLR
jgi:hypothetical protein